MRWSDGSTIPNAAALEHSTKSIPKGAVLVSPNGGRYFFIRMQYGPRLENVATGERRSIHSVSYPLVIEHLSATWGRVLCTIFTASFMFAAAILFIKIVL